MGELKAVFVFVVAQLPLLADGERILENHIVIYWASSAP